MGVIRKLVDYFRVEHLLALIPICGFAVYDSVFASFSAILATLSEAYPDVSTTTIQMILSVPPMVSVPATLLSGLLAAYVNKKYIAEFSLIVILVGGMIPVAFPNPDIWVMFACSACIGLGQGLLHPLANSFICTTWNSTERSRVLGFKQSFNYIGAAVVSFAVGCLAITHWGNAFLVYLGIIPVLVLTHITLPKGRLERRLVTKESNIKGLAELCKPSVLYLFALFLCAMICTYAFNSNIAMLVEEKGLGNTVDVAKITSMASAASFVLAISYGEVTNILGRYTLPTGFALASIGMMVTALAPNLPVAIFGGALVGLGVGIQEISTVYYISMTVNERLVTMAISIVVSCVALGASVSPIVIQGIKHAAFGSDTAAAALIIASCGLFVLTVIEGFHCSARSKAKQIPQILPQGNSPKAERRFLPHA